MMLLDAGTVQSGVNVTKNISFYQLTLTVAAVVAALGVIVRPLYSIAKKASDRIETWDQNTQGVTELAKSVNALTEKFTQYVDANEARWNAILVEHLNDKAERDKRDNQ